MPKLKLTKTVVDGARPEARHLALTPHTLECYRSVGGGSAFSKFGRHVRYAVQDLDAWAAEHRGRGAVWDRPAAGWTLAPAPTFAGGCATACATKRR